MNNSEIENQSNSFAPCEDESKKIILQSLFKPLINENLTDFMEKQKSFVENLNLETLLINKNKKEEPTELNKTLYAVKFEEINLSNNNQNLATIFVGFGIDLDMERNKIGYWLKAADENHYRFWVRVFADIKNSGIEFIHFNCSDDFYWATEALKNVFKSAKDS